MSDDPPRQSWPTDPTPPPPPRPDPAPPIVDEPDAPAQKGGSFFRELPVLVLIAFGLALLIKTFLAQAFFIPSESMLPTLEVQDRVLVNKLVYRFREPRRGEIIVFCAEACEQPQAFWTRVRRFLTDGFGASSGERDFIKRVIGLPGETVEVDRRGRVFITPADGGRRARLDEPYLADEIDDEPFGPMVVPEGSFIVMGDNRPNSSDSRKGLGAIRKDDIIGKAFVRIWPITRFGFFRTPSYDVALAPMGGWQPLALSWPSWTRAAT